MRIAFSLPISALSRRAKCGEKFDHGVRIFFELPSYEMHFAPNMMCCIFSHLRALYKLAWSFKTISTHSTESHIWVNMSRLLTPTATKEGTVASYIDRAADLLFPAEGRRTLNIKFFDACEHTVNAENLAEQIVRAEAQIANGTAVLVTNID